MIKVQISWQIKLSVQKRKTEKATICFWKSSNFIRPYLFKIKKKLGEDYYQICVAFSEYMNFQQLITKKIVEIVGKKNLPRVF